MVVRYNPFLPLTRAPSSNPLPARAPAADQSATDGPDARGTPVAIDWNSLTRRVTALETIPLYGGIGVDFKAASAIRSFAEQPAGTLEDMLRRIASMSSSPELMGEDLVASSAFGIDILPTGGKKVLFAGYRVDLSVPPSEFARARWRFSFGCMTEAGVAFSVSDVVVWQEQANATFFVLPHVAEGERVRVCAGVAVADDHKIGIIRDTTVLETGVATADNDVPLYWGIADAGKVGCAGAGPDGTTVTVSLITGNGEELNSLLSALKAGGR